MRELHYKYWMGILVLTLIVFISRDWYHISDLSQLVSFGVGIASFAVSIVAILQAVLSGYSSQQIAADIKKSNGDLQQAVENISNVSELLRKQVEIVPTSLKEISMKIDAINSEKLRPKHADFVQSEESKDHNRTFLQYLEQIPPSGMFIILFILECYVNDITITWDYCEKVSERLEETWMDQGIWSFINGALSGDRFVFEFGGKTELSYKLKRFNFDIGVEEAINIIMHYYDDSPRKKSSLGKVILKISEMF